VLLADGLPVTPNCPAGAGYKRRVPILDPHVEHYLRHGYVIVPGFLSGSSLAAAQQGMLQ
jgi:hypothetical protein